MYSTKLNGWRDMGPRGLPTLPGHSVRYYQKGPCHAFIAREPFGKSDALLWHLSISCKDRYPGWNEIKDARYTLLPLGLTFAMLLPPSGEYVNIHPNCFHLWEAREFEV